MGILKYMPQESVSKIPKKMIEMFQTKMDQNYDFEIDMHKNLQEQNLREETKAILANLFRDYWATLEQRKVIQAKERYEKEQIEKEKRKKYNPNDIFKKIQK